MTDRDLRIKVNADARQASAEIGGVADAVADVEGTHTARVDADAAPLRDEVDEARRDLSKLTDAQQVVVLRAQADQLRTEIRRAERSVGRLSNVDDIVVRMEARDRATVELERVESRLRDLDGDTATVNVDARGVDDLGDKLDALPGQFGDMSRQLVASFANPRAAIAATVAGLAALGDRTAGVALSARDLSTLTGDSVEQASRLNAVWGDTGADLKDLQDVLLQMGGVLDGNAELAAQIGVNLNDGRSLGERFVQVVELLRSRYDDVAERSVVAAQLFGEEGVRQVNTLINRVGDLGDAVEGVDAGRIVSDEDARRAEEYTRQMAELRAELAELGAEVGTFVLPVMLDFARGLNQVSGQIEGAATSIGQSIRGIFDGGAANRNREVADAIAESERAVDSFDRRLIDHARTVEEVRQIATDYGLDLYGVNTVVVEWARAQDDATEAARRAEAAQGGLAAQLREELGDRGRAVEATERHTEAVRSWVDMLQEAAEAYRAAQFDAFTEDIDVERAQIGLQRQIRRTRQAVAEAPAAAAAGADDAADKRDQARLAQLDLERDVLRYFDLLGETPDERVTRIGALIDRGQYAEVQSLLDELSADREMRVKITPDIQAGFESVAFVLGRGGPSAPEVRGATQPATQYVTVFNPPGSPTTVRNADRVYDQRNGPREPR